MNLSIVFYVIDLSKEASLAELRLEDFTRRGGIILSIIPLEREEKTSVFFAPFK